MIRLFPDSFATTLYRVPLVPTRVELVINVHMTCLTFRVCMRRYVSFTIILVVDSLYSLYLPLLLASFFPLPTSPHPSLSPPLPPCSVSKQQATANWPRLLVSLSALSPTGSTPNEESWQDFGSSYLRTSVPPYFSQHSRSFWLKWQG